jgi:YebC/PmpR family DNA-binding regulatory protein
MRCAIYRNMSGHSHAKTIKHQKDITDKKRGQAFSKMARVISVAVKEGGANPETNAKLHMPKENVERAIARGAGPSEGEKLEEVSFEAYGPGGVAVIIDGITDNKNRTLGEVKQILNQNNGKLVGEGAVRWMFERKGAIVISLKSQNLNLKTDELELMAIEAGAEDIYRHDDSIDVYTKQEELEKVRKALEDRGVKIESASLDWVAKELTDVNERDGEACQKLFDALDDNDAVQDIYSNLK